MHHATNMFSCYIYTAFPRPAVILQCSLRRAFPSQQLFWPSISCVERSTGSKASRAFTSTASPVFSPSSSWRRKATSLRPAVVRSYTARHGEYGNMSEKEFQRHWQKLQLVSLHEIRQIFGENMKKAKGNEILSRLQKRRITGTLDHETKAPSAGAETVAQALTWLRKRYPLDEDAAIVKRIEREEGEREKQFIEEVERAKNWHPQQSAEKDGIYGKPMVDEFAKIWNERQALKIREREEKKKQYAELQANYEAQRIADSSESPDADIIPADARAIYTGQAETSEWMKRYKEKGMLSDGLEPPKMSKAQRLLPMHLLGGLVVLFSIFLADNYKAPPANARMFPDLPVSFVTLQAFTIINFLLFFAWRTPPLWHFMNKNFLNVIATPLARTIVTSAFSHHGVRHLLGNMFGLWLFGLPLHEEVGRGAFLAIFFTSAVTGGLFSLTRYVWINKLDVTSLGASCAVAGLTAAWAWLPTRKDGDEEGFKSWGAWIGRPDLDDHSTWFWRVLLLGLLVAELSRMRNPIKNMDHWGHFGGYLSGICGAEALLWQARRNERRAKSNLELPLVPASLQTTSTA